MAEFDWETLGDTLIKIVKISGLTFFGVFATVGTIWSFCLLVKNRFQVFYKCDECPVGTESPGFCDSKKWRCILMKCTCPCHRSYNKKIMAKYQITDYL